MSSPDHHARLIIWPGDAIGFPLADPDAKLGVKDIVRADSVVGQTIAAMRRGNFPYLRGATVDYLCHGLAGYQHTIALTAHNARQIIVYKVVVTEQPVSGNLVFNNLVFVYDKRFAHLYQAASLAVANGMRAF
ncbi:hypothetical protein [Hymenobacter agri]